MDQENCSEKIKYAHFCPKSDLLGPGQRFILWVQGCEKRCVGCVAQSMQDMNAGKSIGIEALAEKMLSTGGISGVTISGGEPFLQAKSLYLLLSVIKKLQPSFDFIIYTGFLYEDLQVSDDPYITGLLNLVDVLIDGEYVEEQNDDIAYRGSSNQRIIILSNKAEYEEYYGNSSRKSVIQIQGNELYLIGVPSKKTLEVWKNIQVKGKEKWTTAEM